MNIKIKECQFTTHNSLLWRYFQEEQSSRFDWGLWLLRQEAPSTMPPTTYIILKKGLIYFKQFVHNLLLVWRTITCWIRGRVEELVNNFWWKDGISPHNKRRDMFLIGNQKVWIWDYDHSYRNRKLCMTFLPRYPFSGYRSFYLHCSQFLL